MPPPCFGSSVGLMGFLALLLARMTRCTERLQRPVPERLVSAVVSLDVIGNCRRGKPTYLHAEGAQRLVPELRLSLPLPSRRLVPAAPFLLVACLVIGAALLLPITYSARAVDWWLARHGQIV